MDHGRALGLLPGGGWQGFDHLLDLSPKIPPLASLVNGTVMALAGDSPDQASWALALWHGLLLVVVACWGRDLAGRRFGLLAAALLVLVPALAEQRLDYTLDLALAATTTLALWRLGRWQAPAPEGGGRWGVGLVAAAAIGAAILVKQSALLVLLLPCIWAVLRSLRRPRRLAQLAVGLALVLGMLLPWLHHNWITTLSGTNRAVLVSAAREGDPAVFSLASFTYYWRLLPQQLGPVLLLPALAAGSLAAWSQRSQLLSLLRRPLRSLPPGWAWLIGCTIAAWLCTTLSPNKDGRYIAPLLPLLVLLLARGWWQAGLELRSRLGGAWPAGLLAAGLLSGSVAVAQARATALERQPGSPAPAVMAEVRRRVGTQPVTLINLPDGPDLNEHTLTTFGRLNGGQILARRLGRRSEDHPLVLQRSTWVLLASGGDQGSRDPNIRILSERLRGDGRFQLQARWPWSKGRQLELWQRRPEAAAEPFDADFITLARGMGQGPAGLRRLFGRIGAEHQLDGHFLYQERVQRWAQERLSRNPGDADALWSLALIETLRNRPQGAQSWYKQLQALQPGAPWPAIYRTVVLLADWRPGSAANVIYESTDDVGQHPVMRALHSLGRGLVGHPLSLESLRVSVPAAIDSVRSDLDSGEAAPRTTAQTEPPAPIPSQNQAPTRRQARAAQP
jgi:hypothetical protein